MAKLMTGAIQPYAWGSTTYLPEFLGKQPTDEPQAELWLGAHSLASATVDGRPLDELIAADPAGVVGAASVEEFGETLPFLLKVLAIAKPLSLQAHPTRTQAEEGYAREDAAGIALDATERLYKDTWPKPEMVCALVDSEALCGFRDPEATYDLFGQLGVAAATALVAPLVDAALPHDRRLAEVFARVLQLSGDELTVVADVVAAAGAIDVEGDLGLFARTAGELGGHYGDDPGILAALLMNRVAVAPGQAVFLPAGNLHAYLHGAGVEIMANSDNVMRGGLTPKHVDVAGLIAILDFTPGFPGYIEPVEESPGCWRYPTPAPEFALWRLELSEAPVAVPATGFGRVLLVTDGSASVGELTLGRGQAAFVEPAEEVSVTGHGTAFVAGPGLPVP